MSINGELETLCTATEALGDLSDDGQRARVLRYLCDRFAVGVAAPNPDEKDSLRFEESQIALKQSHRKFNEAREEIRKLEIEAARLNVQLTKLAHEFSEMCSQEKQSELLSELLIVDQKNKAIADERDRCARIAAYYKSWAANICKCVAEHIEDDIKSGVEVEQGEIKG